MHIFAESFDYKSANIYDILANVLEYSAKVNCPSAKFELLKVKAPDTTGHERACTSNTVKLDEWVKVVEETNDDVILMDCDMLILGDLSSVFKDHEFDIALCQRTKNVQKRMPFNGGIVFVRNTPAALEFMKLWKRINLVMYNDKVLHNRWRHTYAGMNQAAFGYIYEKEKYDAKIKFLSCKIYNCCREDWPQVDSKTKVIHIKSQLRRAVINASPDRFTIKAYNKWYNMADAGGIDTRFYKMQSSRQCQPVKGNRKQYRRKVFVYESYDDYLKIQKNASLERVGITWTQKDKIAYLCKNYLSLKFKKIKSGICHGARKENEILWFKSALKGCDVIGTDIIDRASNTLGLVQWDFNKENKDWQKRFDFVFSNSLNHSPDPKTTLYAWISQIKLSGIIIVEFNPQIETTLNKVSCFTFSIADLINDVREWTSGKYQVTQKIEFPAMKKSNAKNKTSYLIIERMNKDV